MSIDVEASFSGSGSVNDSNSMRNLIVFQQTYQMNGVTASSSSSAAVTYSYLGNFYYNVKENTYVPISSTVTLPNSAIYLMTNNTTGETWYSTSYISTAYRCFPITVTTDNPDSNPSLSFSGSINMDDFFLPNAFPRSTGLSYSTGYLPGHYGNLNIYSSGVSLSSGQTGFVTVHYRFTGFYNTDGLQYYPIPVGSYMMPFTIYGSSTAANFPSLTALYNSGAYPVLVESNLTSMKVTAFNYTASSFENSLYFNLTDLLYFNEQTWFDIQVLFYTDTSVPSFNYSFDVDGSRTYNVFVRADDNEILNALKSQNNSLESAGGKNGTLNSQNSLMDSTLSEYQNKTDTSEQYSKISDDLFSFDLSIFTSVASTMTLFNACITSIFTQLGDLSVPLTMFLVFVFISAVIGIARVFGGGS